MTPMTASQDAGTIAPPSEWASVSASNAGGPSHTQFISFAIGDDQYGVDIMAVREI